MNHCAARTLRVRAAPAVSGKFDFVNMKSTKQLAKELGLLRKRIPTSKASGKVHKTVLDPRTCQTFNYLIVIDFESTCWKDKKNTNQEIIEFPAVLLNTSNGQLEAEFQQYVMPDEHPILSDFCTEFTGITQEQVENGVPLFVCLNKFTSWLKRIESEKNVAYNTSTDNTKKLCTFVTWSDWDLGVCLHYECQRKQLYKPSALNHWIDARAVYRNFYQRKPKGLNGALQEVGIEFSGRQHSGLDDAKNTARLVWRMIQDGCHFKITKTIQSGTLKAIPRALPQPGPAQQHSRTSVSTSSTTTTVSLQQAPTPQSSTASIPPKTTTSSSSSSSTAAAQKSLASSSSPSRTGQFSLVGTAKPNKRKNNANISIETPKKSCMVPCVTDPQTQLIPFRIYEDQKNEEGKYCVNSNSVTEKNCLGDQDIKTPHTNKQSPQHLSRMDGDNQVTRSVQNGIPIQRTTKSEEFKTPPACPLPFHKQNSIKKYGKLGEKTTVETHIKTPASTRTTGIPSPNGTDSFKTPSNPKKQSVCTTKITPPMCKCGRRSKRRVAVRPGPNQGRAFYSCPGLRRGSGGGLKDTTNSKMGCGFFSWESMVLSEYGSPHGSGSPNGFTAPGSVLKPRTPSPLAMGSIQRAISAETGKNTSISTKGGVTPIGIGYSSSWR